MRHGSLFSGIGGFDLAAQWMGWENVFQVEIDEWCQKVLTKNFPDVQKFKDIKEFRGDPGSVDILSGGFPCQPFSLAGKRKGKSDARNLWPEYFRVIQEIKPTYVVGENVVGLISMEDGKTLEGIFNDLEGQGYQVESFIIPACSVEAWHRRDRIWIVAYSGHPGQEGSHEVRVQRGSESFTELASCDIQPGEIQGNVSDTNSQGLQKRKGQDPKPKRKNGRAQFIRGEWWASEPGVGRVVHGLPNRVDRIKGLGNAIVPQVAYEIFKAIELLDIDRIKP